MKSTFAGYYSYTKSELKEVLSTSIIVLDYSLLIDINKLSHGRLILDILKDFAERLWLPHETAWMYHQMIQDEIAEQINKVNTAKKYLTSFKTATEDPMNHPYISEELISKYNLLMKLAIESLDNEIKFLNRSFYNSEVKDRILNLFEGKIGDEYNEVDLEHVLEEGFKHYDKRQPPCVSIDDFKSKRMQMHNFVVWKQLQKKAKEASKSVVYITNRLSSDWFVFYKDTICLTNPFLRTEFLNMTKKSFFCMPAYQFVKRFMPKKDNRQEYEKLLKQLNKNPQDNMRSSIDKIYNQL